MFQCSFFQLSFLCGSPLHPITPSSISHTSQVGTCVMIRCFLDLIFLISKLYDGLFSVRERVGWRTKVSSCLPLLPVWWLDRRVSFPEVGLLLKCIMQVCALETKLLGLAEQNLVLKRTTFISVFKLLNLVGALYVRMVLYFPCTFSNYILTSVLCFVFCFWSTYA